MISPALRRPAGRWGSAQTKFLRVIQEMKPFKYIAPATAATVLLAAWVATRPLKLRRLGSRPYPAAGYIEAVDRLEAWKSRGQHRLHPACQPILLSHGRQTERAIVFWHGLTSCPRQFYRLGKLFYERGYNVLLPRMPYHGLADRMTTEQARLTAEDMVAFADESIDIARGLGKHVTAFGFSMGGVVGGWAAHHRGDIERLVLLAPAFWIQAFPRRFDRAIINFLLALPNRFRWWDPVAKADAPGPQYAYPRFSTHALAQMLRLGQAVQAAARRYRPVAPSILVITNPNDQAVDNRVAAEVVARWQAHGANVDTYHFDAALGLPHDLISPEQPFQQVDRVYPILLKLVTEED
ncbi:MAG: alpha/beta fold hydrolase [Chloroflexi bacterium]|nr:MAG: alpha/beta fold hydrolase [Chloroflexota bacterium]